MILCTEKVIGLITCGCKCMVDSFVSLRSFKVYRCPETIRRQRRNLCVNFACVKAVCKILKVL